MPPHLIAALIAILELQTRTLSKQGLSKEYLNLVLQTNTPVQALNQLLVETQKPQGQQQEKREEESVGGGSPPVIKKRKSKPRPLRT